MDVVQYEGELLHVHKEIDKELKNSFQISIFLIIEEDSTMGRHWMTTCISNNLTSETTTKKEEERSDAKFMF